MSIIALGSFIALGVVGVGLILRRLRDRKRTATAASPPPPDTWPPPDLDGWIVAMIENDPDFWGDVSERLRTPEMAASLAEKMRIVWQFAQPRPWT